MRRCDKSRCQPIGGHGTPGDLFPWYVYCQYDRQPCYASPYIEWMHALDAIADEDERERMTYDKWLRANYAKGNAK